MTEPDQSGARVERDPWRIPSDIVFRAISVTVVPTIALIVGADVVARYVFSAPLFWAQDINTLLLLLLFFCGQPVCLRYGDHVRMELLYQRFGRTGRRLVDSLSALMGMFLAGTIGYKIVKEMLDPFSAGDTHGFLKVPVMPVRALLVIVLILVVVEALRSLAAIWRD